MQTRTSLETRLGMFVALTVVAVIVILEMSGGPDMFRRSKHLHALFNNVLELKPGDQVKMAGVQIGKVEKIGFETVKDKDRNVTKVKVTMKINANASVPTDSKATVKFAGLLGQNFVSVSIGTSVTQLAGGAYIETVEQTDLGQLMAKLDDVATGIQNVTKSFSGDTIQNVLGPFTDFMKQNQTKLSATIANMQIISGDIAEGKGTVGKLIKDDALYKSALDATKTLNDTGAEVQKALDDVKGLMADAKKAATNVNGLFDDARLVVKDVQDTVKEAKLTVSDINAGKGTFGKLAKDEQLYKETTTAMTNLREILEKVNKGYGTAGKFVNDDSLFKNARMTLQKLDKATEGLEDQGPLSVLGLAVGKLF